MEEACEYGLTRGMCFVARRVEVVAVAGLLRISWCVSGAAGFLVFFFILRYSNAHGLLQVLERLASFTYLLVMSPFFAYRQKKPLHTGVRTGCHYLISPSVRLSVCLCLCVTFVVFTDCESCTRPIFHKPRI